MKSTIYTLIIMLLANISLLAQGDINKPVSSKAVYFDVTPPLRNLSVLKPARKAEILHEVSNKIGFSDADNNSDQSGPGEDPALQHYQTDDPSWVSTPRQNFEGVGNLSFVYPPDTQGDVGPDHYVQVVNSNFAIYSKSGATLLGPAALSTIWNGIPAPWNGTNSGDPVVLYDQAADRWIITQFSLPSGNYAELIAISQTSDPTGSWYRYVFNFGTQMPDYPKFGIWHDGYYMSVNRFLNGSSFSGIGACAFDRTAMLAGDPSAQMIQFTPVTGIHSLLPSDWDGITPPVDGEPNYFIAMSSTNALVMYEFHADWITPANSTFSLTNTLTTSTYDPTICGAFRGRCIPQPGTAVMLESLSDRLMYRLQYRNFGTHRSMVVNHTVDVTGLGLAGIRWYELRNTGSGWSIYQQSTFSPDANHRWMGSIAMNGNGDIALGYSVSNATDIYPSIRYTGRLAGDPLNVMTLPEQNLMTGTGSQTGSGSRWGDYSMMSVDPSDDNTFWYTTEYLTTTGTAPWQTRITSFTFDVKPTVISGNVSLLSETGATLNGTINPNGIPANWYFEWGTTAAYGNSSPSLSAGSGTSVVNVSHALTGLIPGITYHYRLVGVGGGYTITGEDKAFETCAPASVSINASFTEICPGYEVTITATPENGGTTPVYQWFVDGSPVGSGLDSYSYVPSDGDVVTVTMTSSALCPVPPVSTSNSLTFTHVDCVISGYARYNNNPGTLLDGLKITLKQGGSSVGSPVITGANGFYSFNGLSNGTYDLEIASAHASGEWQTWGGVNNTDFLLVSRHASNIALLPAEPPVVRVAASVKAPHPLINNVDANAIRMAARYGWGGSNPYFEIPKWVFSGGSAASPITGIAVNNASIQRNITGLCAGDVNGSYLPGSGVKQQEMGLVLVNEGVIPVAEEMVFPVRPAVSMEIGAITLILRFDPSLLEITGVSMPESGDEEPSFRVEGDRLYIGWMSLSPVSAEANATLLSVHARLRSGDESAISFSLDDSPLSELADAEGNVIGDASLKIAEARAGAVANMVYVYPNPAKESVTIETRLERDGILRAELSDLQGVILITIPERQYLPGTISTRMDVSNLAAGVYLLRVTTNEGEHTLKVVVSR